MRQRAAVLLFTAFLSTAASPVAAIPSASEVEPAGVTRIVRAPEGWFSWLWSSISSVFLEDRGYIVP